MSLGSLLLVDGTQVLHRVLYAEERADAQDHYQSQDILDTRAVASFLSMLRPLLMSMRPRRCVVVWDGGGWSQRRLTIYPEYKSQRITVPPEKEEAHQKHFERFQEQRAFLEKFLELLCIPSIRLAKREADDVIAYIALSQIPHSKVTIFSDDQDFRQLVVRGVEIYRPSQKNFLVPGVLPDDKIPHASYLLYKACLGDPSDNIRGITGVGEKTLGEIFLSFKGKTAGELYEFLSGLRGQGARIDRLLDGFAIVLRNLHLLDLTLESFTPEEEQILEHTSSALAGKMIFHSGKIEMALRKYGMNKALQNFDYWVEPFARLGVQSRFTLPA